MRHAPSPPPSPRSRTTVSLAIVAVALALSMLGGTCLDPKPTVYAPTRDLVPDGAVPILKLGTPAPIRIPDELVSLAPQYFSHQVRDAFQVGNSGFYDPADPTVRHAFPQGMYRFWRSFGETLVGYGSDGVRVARRDETESHPVAHDTPNLGLVAGTRARNDDLWFVLSERPDAPTNLSLLRVRGTSGQVFPNPLGTRPRIQRGDAAVAGLDDDRVAIAWVEPSAAGLALMLSFRDPTGSTYSPPLAADAVMMPADAAALSGRTGTELVLVGLVDRVAIAWRPLVPTEPVETGTATTPPSRPVHAELRIVVADGRSSPTLIRHDTWAVPLGGTSGIGPWPLSGCGLTGTRVGETSVFAWNDVAGSKAHVVATVGKPGDAPHEVASLYWRLQFRTSTAGTDLLMFAPNGAVQAVPVRYEP